MQSSNFYFQASAVPASRFFPSSSSSCRAPSLSAPPAHALLLLLPHSLYLCPQLTLSSSASRRAPAVPAPADALLRLPPRSALPRAHAPLLLLLLLLPPLSHSLFSQPPDSPPRLHLTAGLPRLPAPAPDQAARPPFCRLLLLTCAVSRPPPPPLARPAVGPRPPPLPPRPTSRAAGGAAPPLPPRASGPSPPSLPAALPGYLGYPAPAHAAQLLLCPPAIRGAPCRSPAAAQRCPLPAASLASPLIPLAPRIAPCYFNHLPPLLFPANSVGWATELRRQTPHHLPGRPCGGGEGEGEEEGEVRMKVRETAR